MLGRGGSSGVLRLLQEIKYPGIDGKLLSRKGRAMELSQAVKDILNETQADLSGYKRRYFMAQVVQSIFDGKCIGQRDGEMGKTVILRRC